MVDLIEFFCPLIVKVKMRIRKLISLWIIIPLCGCVAIWGQSYHIESKNLDSVVIKYDPSLTNIQNIQTVADNYCHDFGKDAAPDELLPNSIWAMATVSFKCTKLSAEEKTEVEQREIAIQERKQIAATMIFPNMGMMQTYNSFASPRSSCPSCEQMQQRGQASGSNWQKPPTLPSYQPSTPAGIGQGAIGYDGRTYVPATPALTPGVMPNGDAH